jgi:hypothetical protein
MSVPVVGPGIQVRLCANAALLSLPDIHTTMLTYKHNNENSGNNKMKDDCDNGIGNGNGNDDNDYNSNKMQLLCCILKNFLYIAPLLVWQVNDDE